MVDPLPPAYFPIDSVLTSIRFFSKHDTLRKRKAPYANAVIFVPPAISLFGGAVYPPYNTEDFRAKEIGACRFIFRRVHAQKRP